MSITTDWLDYSEVNAVEVRWSLGGTWKTKPLHSIFAWLVKQHIEPDIVGKCWHDDRVNSLPNTHVYGVSGLEGLTWHGLTLTTDWHPMCQQGATECQRPFYEGSFLFPFTLSFTQTHNPYSPTQVDHPATCKRPQHNLTKPDLLHSHLPRRK